MAPWRQPEGEEATPIRVGSLQKVFVSAEAMAVIPHRHLFASSDAMDSATADAWLRQLLTFLEEDKALVESAQRGYEDDFKPGPPHRLERRILHWQGLYRERLGSDGMINVERSQSTMSALIESTSATGSAANGCSGM